MCFSGSLRSIFKMPYDAQSHAIQKKMKKRQKPVTKFLLMPFQLNFNLILCWPRFCLWQCVCHKCSKYYTNASLWRSISKSFASSFLLSCSRMYILIDEKINMSFLSIYQTFIQNGAIAQRHHRQPGNWQNASERAMQRTNEACKHASSVSSFAIFRTPAPHSAMHGIHDGSSAASLSATNCWRCNIK